MKFGKQLEISANPEWRDSYVQYKRLKRLIKRVAFEVEKKTQKQEKLLLQQQQAQYGTSAITGSSPPRDIDGNLSLAVAGGGSPARPQEAIDAVYLRVVDESHPLLRAAVDEVKAAKEDFWEVTGENLKVVNDFYIGRVVSLQKSIKDFEETIMDETNSRGHVHSRARTLSQGALLVVCGYVHLSTDDLKRTVLYVCIGADDGCVCACVANGTTLAFRSRLRGAAGYLRHARGSAHVRADQPLGLPQNR